MYDFPDGKVVGPLIAALDSGGADDADLALGADVYFWSIRIVATAATTVVLWRPKLTDADTAPLTSGDAYSVSLAASGDAWESPLFPANQRPAVARFLATAGQARVEILRVVRQ